VVIWGGSGFYIVQEGQQAVVTTFGKYSQTKDAGFQWRLPFPVQAHETVAVSQLQSVEVGRSGVVQATGLRDSSMLTQDENIVDIRFTVQYRRTDARAYLFENNRADEAVVMAAETAVREIVGKSRVDLVLYEQRDAIAVELVGAIQAQLDRLKAGITVANVNLQSVQVPEQVQAAFNDAFKATADRDRFKNEGQAYASDVIPKARGTASRLMEEAEGYRSRVVAQAEGDAQRFRSVLAEYQKAPGVTRATASTSRRCSRSTPTSARSWSTAAAAATCCTCRWTACCSRRAHLWRHQPSSPPRWPRRRVRPNRRRLRAPTSVRAPTPARASAKAADLTSDTHTP
jgi:membrane protease subunit HflK